MSDQSADAKYLMNNAAFVAALDNAKAQALRAALGCDAKDDESRRRYLDAVRTVDKVAAHLNALLQAEQPEDVSVADFYQEQAKRRWAAFVGL